jgi:hypothetical protein
MSQIDLAIDRQQKGAACQRADCEFTSWILLTYSLTFVATGSYENALVSLFASALWFLQPILSLQQRKSAATILLFCSALAVLHILVPTSSVSAQFLNNAEEFFSSSFEGVDEAIELLFNGVRAVYVIYLAVSLWRAFQESRGGDGEDFATLARTPAKVLIIVTLADVLVGILTGTGA